MATHPMMVPISSKELESNLSSYFHSILSSIRHTPWNNAAPSKAVLVQLTPLLGALVGAAVTLFLVAICVIIFVKFKTKVSLPVGISIFDVVCKAHTSKFVCFQ